MTEAQPGGSPLTLIVVGVSAGGPKALQQILPRLSHGFAAPVLVIQHFAAELFNSLLVTLSSGGGLPVTGAENDLGLEGGHVYLCPPDHQCRVSRRGDQLVCRLTADMESTYRPSIDETMHSVAASCGPGAIGVLLTGMGADGVEGLRSIVDAGGLTIVESEETASIYGMPREALYAGVAQRVLPLHQIPTELLMELRHREQTAQRRGMEGREKSETQGGSVRQEATRNQVFGDADAVTEQIQQLQSDVPIAVESAKQKLIALPGRVVLPELVVLLSSDVPVVRATAVEIAKRVALDRAGVSLLDQLCRNPDPDLRLFAVDIAKAHASEDLLDVVLGCCDDENANVALMALAALGAYADRRAVERLAGALTAAAPQRAVALTALGRSPAADATDHLIAARLEGHSERFLWLRALSMRADPAAVLPILACIEHDPGDLLPHALDTLASLYASCSGPLPEEALAQTRRLPFEAYFTDPDPRVRESAIRLIGAVGTEHHIEVLSANFEQLGVSERALFLATLAAFPGDRAGQLLRRFSDHDDSAVAALASDLLRGL